LLSETVESKFSGFNKGITSPLLKKTLC